jgi:hypothetical protein
MEREWKVRAELQGRSSVIDERSVGLKGYRRTPRSSEFSI